MHIIINLSIYLSHNQLYFSVYLHFGRQKCKNHSLLVDKEGKNDQFSHGHIFNASSFDLTVIHGNAIQPGLTFDMSQT